MRFSPTKPDRLAPLDIRNKRGVSFATELAQDVCPSVSDWVAKREALDPYGNQVSPRTLPHCLEVS